MDTQLPDSCVVTVQSQQPYSPEGIGPVSSKGEVPIKEDISFVHSVPSKHKSDWNICAFQVTFLLLLFSSFRVENPVLSAIVDSQDQFAVPVKGMKHGG